MSWCILDLIVIHVVINGFNLFPLELGWVDFLKKFLNSIPLVVLRMNSKQLVKMKTVLFKELTILSDFIFFLRIILEKNCMIQAAGAFFLHFKRKSIKKCITLLNGTYIL